MLNPTFRAEHIGSLLQPALSDFANECAPSPAYGWRFYPQRSIFSRRAAPVSDGNE